MTASSAKHLPGFKATHIDDLDHAVPDHEPALLAPELSHLVLKEALPGVVLDKLHGGKDLLRNRREGLGHGRGNLGDCGFKQGGGLICTHLNDRETLHRVDIVSNLVLDDLEAKVILGGDNVNSVSPLQLNREGGLPSSWRSYSLFPSGSRPITLRSPPGLE